MKRGIDPNPEMLGKLIQTVNVFQRLYITSKNYLVFKRKIIVTKLYHYITTNVYYNKTLLSQILTITLERMYITKPCAILEGV